MAARSSGAKDQAREARAGFMSQPYAGLIIGGVVTIITALVANLFQSVMATRLERQKLESALIIKAVETLDPAVSSRNLCFLLKAGLIQDPKGRIAAASSPADAPVFATASGEPIRLNAAQRASFMDNYGKTFGAADPAIQARLRDIFDYLEKNPAISDLKTLAYTLATIRHDSSGTFRPLTELGSAEQLERRYGPDTPQGRSLGNSQAGDGFLYRGRGYLQLTGRRNYQRVNGELGLVGTPDDLETNPDALLKPDLSFRAMVWGLTTGYFTGRKISDFVTAEKADYRNARKAVNGLDHAEQIAADAVKFEQVLGATARAKPETCNLPPRPGAPR
jgi:putative chitinase